MLRAHLAVISGNVFVAVPIAPWKAVVGSAPQLHETHAALQQPPSDQAVAAKVLRRLFVDAVHSPRGFGLLRDVENARGAQLQLGRQFVRGDASIEPRVAFSSGQMRFVEVFQERQRGRFAFGRDKLGVGRREEIGDGIFGGGADKRALMRGRQKARAPVARPVGRKAPRVGQHHERGQVVGHAPQSVGDPRAHRGEAGQHEPAVLHERGWAVYVRLGDHRMDKRHVVDAGSQMRHQVAHPLTALAILLPAPGACHAGAGITLKQLDLLAGVERLAVELDQLGLVVERVALAGGAGHEHLHDAFGFRRMVHADRHFGRLRIGQHAAIGQKLRQRNAAQAAAQFPQELAPRACCRGPIACCLACPSCVAQSTNTNSLLLKITRHAAESPNCLA